MMDLKKYKNVHCIGIGGIGLSGIAEILLQPDGVAFDGVDDYVACGEIGINPQWGAVVRVKCGGAEHCA
jgi:hypothetical protein